VLLEISLLQTKLSLMKQQISGNNNNNLNSNGDDSDEKNKTKVLLHANDSLSFKSLFPPFVQQLT
jgi:hypothetical protein